MQPVSYGEKRNNLYLLMGKTDMGAHSLDLFREHAGHMCGLAHQHELTRVYFFAITFEIQFGFGN